VDHRKLRALALIRRFNFERCNRHESVAEHVLFVALLAMDAAEALEWDWKRSSLAVCSALLHDSEEAVTGDIPYLVKRSLPRDAVADLEGRAIQELGTGFLVPQYASDLVEFCDIVELLMYLSEERLTGNRALDPIYGETAARMVGHALWPSLRSWASGLLGLEGSELEAYAGTSFGGLKH
jgi:hypothetical protein